MTKQIITYSIKKELSGVEITRYNSGRIDVFFTADWTKAINFLTTDLGEGFHITWDLDYFSKTLFTLLPEQKQEELLTKTKVYDNHTKIFHTGQWLGLGGIHYIKNNLYSPMENNFFGLSHWLTNIEAPNNLEKLSKISTQVLEALELLGIKPDKLTSPVGILFSKLNTSQFPTLFSNPNLLPASNFCLPMMKLEWRETFQSSLYAPVYSYDMISAYPSFIANLPDTNECEIRYSKEWEIYNWGIVRVEIEVQGQINPLVDSNNKRMYFTTDEIKWLIKSNHYEINFIDGYFLKWKTDKKPFKSLIHSLFQAKQSKNTILAEIARRMSQGISGKLDQENKDGTFGELYNPILAAMVRSQCRLAVGDFIYNNNLQDDLASVNVDGVSTFKEIKLKETGELGTWRKNKETILNKK